MRKFSAKILLFGEYSILNGSSALVIPYSKFKAQFDFLDETENEEFINSNQTLQNLYFFLVQKSTEQLNLHLGLFKEDIEKGIFFRSEIPIQYGLGSSGALVAAIFDRYGIIDKEEIDIAKLRSEMARVESFFHGESSAIDPLCIFYNSPLFIANNKISFLGFNKLYPILNHFFLLDTELKGKTNKYMMIFLSLQSDPFFRKEYKKDYLPAINKLYIEMIRKNHSAVKEIISRISRFQLKFFVDMIPESILKVWKKGIQSEEYFMKLCGSGGGGYILVYSTNKLHSLSMNIAQKLYKIL